MPRGTKIATCCYCGTRAALVLRGRISQELACASCGAPLHDLKMLPSSKVADRPVSRNPDRGRRSMVTPAAHFERKAPGPVRKKRRKGLGRRFLEEAFDVIEDIFD